MNLAFENKTLTEISDSNVRSWVPTLKLKNGTIYKENGGGTYLISAGFPVQPSILQSLLLAWDEGDGKSQIWPNAELVGHGEDSSDILQVIFQPFNWQQNIFQPRSLLLKRCCSQTNEQCFTITFEELDKDQCPYIPCINFDGTEDSWMQARMKYFKIYIFPSFVEGFTSQMIIVLSMDLNASLLDQEKWFSRCLELDVVWVQSFLEFVYNAYDIVNGQLHSLRLDQGLLYNVGATISYKETQDNLLNTNQLESLHPTSNTNNTTPPPVLSEQYWSSPGEGQFRVRGPTYLTDKIKIHAPKPRYELQAVELVKMKQVVPHLSRFVACVSQSSAAFNFVLSLMMPFSGDQLGVVIVFSTDQKPQEQVEPGMHPFDLCMARFLSGGDDEVKSAKLKLIPAVGEGSWVLKQAVGTTPVILGRKLSTSYHRGPNYIEAQFDIGSNSTAAYITNLAANATKTLVLDMALLLEGTTEQELPEYLIGTVRFNKLNLKKAIPLQMDSDAL
eukprot:TRINITY_DN9237_c0_g1_i2.p1 TRINITY_DN9237_c0_g1~~TRINITY_DN9237_c0_g1_i2.p1  ORF type:complete len:502 (-),score=31.95 TRINITY_DN9237_c0_g1_i2:449-1954(-)